MTITIKNASPELLKAVKSMAKLDNAKVSSKQERTEIAKKWQQEADEALQLYKKGKLKAYNTAQEMHKAILDEI
ncbi:hypothetical protein [Helicobacter japonicus]|uniref:hypothetical protein n=1 Tax=Helicobacter japonicus TaxID=425400 RepID=UPI0023F23F49|nr:hypothetical protein [Helicobacter japonicus]